MEQKGSAEDMPQGGLYELESFGEPRQTLDMTIEGVLRKVTIYSRDLDDTWILYTSIDDEGKILASHQSLNGRIFSEQDLQEHYEKHSRETPR